MMAQKAVFRWHEAAKLFAAEAEISRAGSAAPAGFRAIASRSSADDVKALGEVVQAGRGFCLSDAPLPEGIHTPESHFLTLTGGSSGQPKVIQRSMASWIASFEVNAAQFNLNPHDSLAVLGKLSHSLALYGVVEALYLGLNAHVLDAFSPSGQVEYLKNSAITVLYATPTQLRLLCKSARGVPLPAQRLILCGGGALDSETAKAVRALCPNAALHQFYGAAETSFVTMTSPTGAENGQGHPFPGVSLRVLDETGHATNGVGEVWVKSPYLFDSYVAGASPDTRWRDGYLSVGELGQLDATGALHLSGRKSRQITIADQTICPEVIETFLNAQPDMPICALLPLPDKLRGQRLIAVLEGHKDSTLANKIRQACRKKFGALATPAQVRFINEMPLLASGKIDLLTLARWLEGTS